MRSDEAERFRRIADLAERYAALGSSVFVGASAEDEAEVRSMLAPGEDPLDRPLVDAASVALLATSVGRRGAAGSAERPRVPGLDLLRHLGDGAHAEVWEALELAGPRRRVAVKLLAASGSLPRFELEREVIGRMSHEGIARVHFAGVTPEGRPYLVMELVDGRPFLEVCAAERLDAIAVARLLRDVCRAVQHAHDRGVLHRDLKSTNVLVGRDERGLRATVIDFGIAKAIARGAGPEHTIAGQLVGTPASMSPEQLSGRIEAVDVRSDVYALGTLLFEALAGRPRWDLADRSLLQAIDHIANTPPLSLRSVAPTTPAELAAIVEAAVAQRPQDRYPSAAALGDDLERWLRGEPIVALPPSWRRRAAWWVRRHRLASAVGAGVAVGAIGLLAAGIVGYRAQLRENAELRQWMTTTVATLKELSDLPGSLEQRDRLSAFVLAKIGDLPRDADAELVLADAFLTRSDVLRQRGALDEAEELRRRALDLLRAAHSASPADAALARRVALAEVLVGDAERERGDETSALVRYRVAHDLYAALAARADAASADRVRLAFSHDRLCDVLTARSDEARAIGSDADRSASRAEAREHAEAMWRLASAEGVGLHARIAARARLLATAPPDLPDSDRTALHEACIDDAELLVASSPRNRTYAHLLAARVGEAVLHHSAAGRFDRAAELAALGVARLDALLDAEPDQLDTRYHLAEILATMAVVEIRRGDRVAARAILERGVEVAAPLIVAQGRNPAYAGVVARLEVLTRDQNQEISGTDPAQPDRTPTPARE